MAPGQQPTFYSNLVTCERTVLSVNKIFTDWHDLSAAIKAVCAQQMHFALTKWSVCCVPSDNRL